MTKPVRQWEFSVLLLSALLKQFVLLAAARRLDDGNEMCVASPREHSLVHI